MVDDLLRKWIIQLSEPKRPKEVGKTAEFKYCRYYEMVSQPHEKCVTLKEYIMHLPKMGRIIVDLDDAVEENMISYQTKNCPPFLEIWSLSFCVGMGS